MIVPKIAKGLCAAGFVLLLTACSGRISTTAPQSYGPCSQDPSCTTYSGTRASYHGHPVSWIAEHPFTGEYYRTGDSGEFVAVGPCNLVDLPLSISGSTLTVDVSNIIASAEGCATGSQTASHAAVFSAVFRSKQLRGRIDPATKTITFSAGTNRIAFVTA
jgi:hypothetical protein